MPTRPAVPAPDGPAQDGPAQDGRLPGWRVVLPVKGGASAKTRLAAVTSVAPGLALALALDCLDAVLAASCVSSAWVVTADDAVAAAVTAAGARAVAESRPGAGLLGAVHDGLRAASTHDEGGSAGEQLAGRRAAGVAVLLADLPCLRPGDLDAALEAAGAALATGDRQVCVPDAEGSGTVLLAAASADALRPRFGPASAAAHRAQGARLLELDLPRLRRDVDTPGELTAALALGVGPRTAAVVCPGRRADGRPSGRVGGRARPQPTATGSPTSTGLTCAPSAASLSAKCS